MKQRLLIRLQLPLRNYALARVYSCSKFLWLAGKQVVHLILSRSATGSSVRFAAAFACAFLALQPPPVMPLTPSGSTDRLAHLIGSAAARAKRRRGEPSSTKGGIAGVTALPGEAVRPVTARCACVRVAAYSHASLQFAGDLSTMDPRLCAVPVDLQLLQAASCRPCLDSKRMVRQLTEGLGHPSAERLLPCMQDCGHAGGVSQHHEFVQSAARGH